MSSSPLTRFLQTLLIAALLTISHLAAADPLAEIKAASGLETLDAHRLLHGEILTARGTPGSFARGVSAESCYFLKGTPDTVKTALQHWDPSRYKETEVSAYQTYHWPSSPEMLKTFQLESKIPADRPLLDWTVQAVASRDPGELHLRPADLDKIRAVCTRHDLSIPGQRDALVNAGWQQVLQDMSLAVGTGGFAALPAYQANGVTIRASDEFKSLLKMTPAIAARFAPLTGARPFFPDGTTEADEVVPYAEESQVRGHTSFCLGATASLRTSTGWQAFDCTYYTADTFFVSVTLYQMWPWENGTLVWEVDYASAPFRSYLGGLDRLFAGKEMTRDSTGAVQTFRKEIAAQGR